MQTVSLRQGSPEWHAHRAAHRNASDAPAMMGCSPYTTYEQLLHRVATGVVPEVDASTQRRFDDGHRFESLAGPLMDEIAGEPLAPVVGVSGAYSASFDGLSLMGDVAAEHKTLNDALREAMQPGCTGNYLPLMYQVQMEHQAMVAGPALQRILFMATKWSGDTLVEQRHCWYTPNPALRARIVAGWEKFEQDVAGYVRPAAAAVKPTGKTMETLPALRVEVSGTVTASNLEAFKEHALAAIASINRELKTDQDFADAEQAVKWCGEVKARAAAAKNHALSQTETIDLLFRALDEIAEKAGGVGRELEKLIKTRKDTLRDDIIAEGIKGVREHVAKLNARLGKAYMPAVSVDFGAAVKGKRNFDLMRQAVQAAMRDAIITASETADRIEANLAHLVEHAAGLEILFPDLPTLVNKAADDFAAMVATRKAEHERKEQERQAKAAQVTAPAPVPAPAPAAPAPAVVALHPAAATSTAAEAQAITTAPALRLGVINERLAPIQLTADGLRALGFAPAGKDRAAVLYHESDFPRMCAALINHVTNLQRKAA